MELYIESNMLNVCPVGFPFMDPYDGTDYILKSVKEGVVTCFDGDEGSVTETQLDQRSVVVDAEAYRGACFKAISMIIQDVSGVYKKRQGYVYVSIGDNCAPVNVNIDPWPHLDYASEIDIFTHKGYSI